MPTPYEIDIMMSANTIAALKTNGFSLYGFKAVQTSSGGAAPTVWFQSNAFLQTTQVQWSEQYQAYISDSQIIANGVITANTAVDIDLEQTADADAVGNLTVDEQGTPSAISIANQSSVQWTAGISEMVNGVANPMCALPLFGNMLEVIAPIEKVLLMFASTTVDTGTVIYKGFSAGVLVDLTAVQTRSLTFDINNSWNWGGAGWGTAVPAQADLVPLLIGDGSTISARSPTLAGARQRLAGPSDAPGSAAVTVPIAAGGNHVFPAGTLQEDLELDNRHNVAGNVQYRIANRRLVTVPIVPNEEQWIRGINGQQLSVTNNLPNSLYCVY